ncbi:MAG TPA: hypothetical protein VEA41_01680 [Salinarimonas sp.]|nr:hypothetical protein [Salinarimonas sp.]
MPDRNETLAVVTALVVALAVVAGAVVLAAMARPSTAGGLPGEATCAEWTDGCILCRRTEAGPACTTPGIACMRGPARCLRREGA